MKFAAIVSSTVHALILTYIAVGQFEVNLSDEVQQIDGPEVISYENYCDLNPRSCTIPESSSVINPLLSLKEDNKVNFEANNFDVNSDKIGNPATLEEPGKEEIKPHLEISEILPSDSDEAELNKNSYLESKGNETRLDAAILSREKPPPRNSQRITDIASNVENEQTPDQSRRVNSVNESSLELVDQKEQGGNLEESSAEITVEGKQVEAVLDAAPKMASLPPGRPKTITKKDSGDELSSVDYNLLVSDALDQMPIATVNDSENELNRALDNYTLYKVEQDVRSFYNTAVLSGLSDPEAYKVRVKFFVNADGVNRATITLLEPRNPSDTHIISFKAARNAIIKALGNKKNYISREKYPSGINIILNFTPSLGVGRD